MFDFVTYSEKAAVVALAHDLDYEMAAQELSLSTDDLKALILELELKLELSIFESSEKGLSVTKEGLYLVQMFRDALSRHSGDI